MRIRAPHVLVSLLGLALVVGNAGCLFQHRAVNNPLAGLHSQQPDKVLYDAAMKDMSKGKYTVARLNLETLMNTYPDSEYLARAKMAIANSWYLEGGVDGMAQAEAQYKDFITFFPADKEAAVAQLKIAQIHYDQLEKPGRDPTQARDAQAALRTFLLTYPTSPDRPKALQMLRDTQEVLADRLYGIANFYLQRAKNGDYADYRAAQSRFDQLLIEYPLYSQGDLVLDQLGHSYLTTSARYAGAEAYETNPQDKQLFAANAKSDRAHAVADFRFLIERYPLSPYAKDAAQQLAALNAPVPKPSPQAIAFNRKEIAGRGKAIAREGFLSHWGFNGLLSTHPLTQIARADKVGNPPLSQVTMPPDPPPPGLEALLRTSMIKSGAIPANSHGPLPLANAALATQLAQLNTGAVAAPGQAQAVQATVGSDAEASAGDTAADDPVAGGNTAPSGALSFQNVSSQPQGAGAPLYNNDPQAVAGNNDNDPNARKPVTSDDPNVVLTPNELDMENRDQILAAGIHRSIPPPAQEMAKFVAAQKKLKRADTKKKGAPPVPGASSHGKSIFSRLWP